MALSERKKEVLKAIVDDYVTTAEPVGSKAVVARMRTNVSSATVRNEMADLERLGYLEKPHTSAGRIPSHLGYRYYVDELMGAYSSALTDVDLMVRSLTSRMGQLDSLITEAGRMVSELTQHPAFTVSPTAQGESVRRFEVIRVDSETVVLVLVTTTDLIKNKICHLSFPLSDLDVAAANRALNNHFTNIPIEQLTDERITAAENGAGADITEVLVAAIDFASDVLNNVIHRDIHLEGMSHILKFPEFREPGKAMALLDCLTDREMLALLPMPDDNNPVQIRIGSENGENPLSDTSLVVASYHTAKGATGLLGVVGPTRMDYVRVSSRLKRFADELSGILNKDSGR